ncbi:MAG: hypothetical protein ACREK1_02660 [Longimicrobiales bacterium]
MKRVAVLLPIWTISLIACGPAVSSAVFTDAAPRGPDHEIQVFSTKLPSCPYEEVGLVRAKRRGFASLQDVLTAVRERAREMGGDAVIAMGQTESVTGGVGAENVVSVSSQEGLAGTVIRFADRNCRE